jgi:hypothetical protein
MDNVLKIPDLFVNTDMLTLLKTIFTYAEIGNHFSAIMLIHLQGVPMYTTGQLIR